MANNRFEILEPIERDAVVSTVLVCDSAAAAVSSDLLRLMIMPEIQKGPSLRAAGARPWLNALPVSGLGWMEMNI